MKVAVRAVLFKRITDINWRAITGRERGQYDLRLGADAEFGAFFDVVPDVDPTTHGGWSRLVALQPFMGSNPVPEHHVTFRYMGPQSTRKDYYFASQKHDLPEAYPLWRPGRVAPLDAAFADVEGAVVVVVRDAANRFHARWLSREAVDRLPSALRLRIEQDSKGVYEVIDATAPISPKAQEVLDALLDHHNVLVYGPPGTGKTFVVQEVMRSFETMTLDTDAEHDPITDGSTTHSLWSTFHQSYSYEDFIVGLRPRPRDEGGFVLDPVPGTLLELSEWARQPGRRALLVIDEINRGNVSRIFGELITLLETDKRLDPDGNPLPTTVSVRLPYVAPGDDLSVALPDGTNAEVPYPFTLPHRVYVLATMNSVDTSVAPLDAALRRRFTMLQLTPDVAGMQAVLGLGTEEGLPELDAALPDRDAVCGLALHVLQQVNQGIGMFLGPDFQFGHWYLEPLVGLTDRDDAIRALADVWRNALFPQLIEYFSGRSEQLLAVLRDPESSEAIRVEIPNAEWEALGASAYLSPPLAPSDEAVMELLIHVSGQQPLNEAT